MHDSKHPNKNKKIQKTVKKTLKKRKVVSADPTAKKSVSKPSSVEEEEENSFFNDLPISISNIETQNKENRREVIERVIKKVVACYEGRSLKEIQKRNKINAIIELAENVKDKWI